MYRLANLIAASLALVAIIVPSPDRGTAEIPNGGQKEVVSGKHRIPPLQLHSSYG